MSDWVLRRALGEWLDGRTVIGREDIEAIRSASSLIDQAQKEAARILAEARMDAERIRKDAQREAAQAVERGHREGWAEAQRLHGERIASEGAKAARVLPRMDERIGLLVTRSLNKILSEKEGESRFFESVVQRVIRAARDEKFLQMRVCRAQAQTAREAVARVLADAQAPDFIEVVEDENLKHGACMIESPQGVVDASLETQLESIRQALTSVWRKTDGTGMAT